MKSTRGKKATAGVFKKQIENIVKKKFCTGPSEETRREQTKVLAGVYKDERCQKR